VETIFQQYVPAAQTAQLWFRVNAGYDLNLQNLGKFCSIPGILKSGHALIADGWMEGYLRLSKAYYESLIQGVDNDCSPEPAAVAGRPCKTFGPRQARLTAYLYCDATTYSNHNCKSHRTGVVNVRSFQAIARADLGPILLISRPICQAQGELLATHVPSSSDFTRFKMVQQNAADPVLRQTRYSSSGLL